MEKNIKKYIKNEKIYYVLKLTSLFILFIIWDSIFFEIFGKFIINLSVGYKVFFSFIVNLLFLILIVFVYFKTLKKDFKLFFKDFFNNLEISIKYWLIGFIVMVISNLIIIIITNGAIAGNEEEVRKIIDISPLYMLFSVSIYAPLTEELLFRKGFRDIIKNKWLYIIISGGIFGGLHVLPTIIGSWLVTESIIISELLFLVPYCSLGIAFAYTYYKTNNIFSTICMHSIHNTMAIILYLIGSGL